MTNNNQTTCLECGVNIASKRKDAKYCSDRCRMRYQRAQKKVRFIAELFGICSTIPNHTFKNHNGESTIRLMSVKNNKTEIYTLKMLYSLNISQIKELITRKKREVKAHKLLNPFFFK